MSSRCRRDGARSSVGSTRRSPSDRAPLRSSPRVRQRPRGARHGSARSAPSSPDLPFHPPAAISALEATIVAELNGAASATWTPPRKGSSVCPASLYGLATHVCRLIARELCGWASFMRRQARAFATALTAVDGFWAEGFHEPSQEPHHGPNAAARQVARWNLLEAVSR